MENVEAKGDINFDSDTAGEVLIVSESKSESDEEGENGEEEGLGGFDA